MSKSKIAEHYLLPQLQLLRDNTLEEAKDGLARTYHYDEHGKLIIYVTDALDFLDALKQSTPQEKG